MKHLCLDKTKVKRIDQFGGFRKDTERRRAYYCKSVNDEECVCLLAPRGCVRWSIQNKDLGVKLPHLSYS